MAETADEATRLDSEPEEYEVSRSSCSRKTTQGSRESGPVELDEGAARRDLETFAEWAEGPHDKSNWLIRGKVIVGGWPYRLPKGRGSPGESLEEGEAKLRNILEAGVNTFASYTEKSEIRSQPFCYSTFKANAAMAYAEMHGPRRAAKRGGREIRFLMCPMPDGGVGPDESLARHLSELLAEISERRVLYIHCYGGHGRSGIVGCALLCLVYGYGAAEAVQIFNTLHSARIECGVGGPGQFPHSQEQLEQVVRVADLQGSFEKLRGADKTGADKTVFDTCLVPSPPRTKNLGFKRRVTEEIVAPQS